MNYEKAIHYDPNYVDAYYNVNIAFDCCVPIIISDQLGVVNIRLNNDKEAEKSFRQALKLQPRHISSLFNLALLLKDTGRQEESEKL